MKLKENYRSPYGKTALGFLDRHEDLNDPQVREWIFYILEDFERTAIRGEYFEKYAKTLEREVEELRKMNLELLEKASQRIQIAERQGNE